MKATTILLNALKEAHKADYFPVFKIFKEGATEKPVTIVKKQGEPFNEVAKREKYKSLGYTIIEL